MPVTKSRRKKNPAHTAYERALTLLYKSDYTKAQAALEALVQKYPDEQQIMARVRLFLRLCEENKRQPKATLGGTELYDLGVFEHNNGHFEEAINQFKMALEKVSDTTDEAAVYSAIAASFARIGDAHKALGNLEKAIKMDAVHRYHAQHDPDFESLASNEDFKELIATGQGQ